VDRQEPAKAIKSAKVEDADVLPFNESEVKKILKACKTATATASESRPLLN